MEKIQTRITWQETSDHGVTWVQRTGTLLNNRSNYHFYVGMEGRRFWIENDLSSTRVLAIAQTFLSALQMKAVEQFHAKGEKPTVVYLTSKQLGERSSQVLAQAVLDWEVAPEDVKEWGCILSEEDIVTVFGWL
jgi:hypothetical protein